MVKIRGFQGPCQPEILFFCDFITMALLNKRVLFCVLKIFFNGIFGTDLGIHTCSIYTIFRLIGVH